MVVTNEIILVFAQQFFLKCSNPLSDKAQKCPKTPKPTHREKGLQYMPQSMVSPKRVTIPKVGEVP